MLRIIVINFMAVYTTTEAMNCKYVVEQLATNLFILYTI